MKKIVMLLVVCLLLSGQISIVFAAPAPNYLDPDSRSYKKPVIGAICERCYSTFMVSGHQIANNKEGMCPYCGYEQNLKVAAERYSESQLIIRKHEKGIKN